MSVPGILLLILGVSAWFSVMAWTTTLTLWPGLLRITKPLVCTKGTKLVVKSFRTGRSRGITITCEGEDTSRDVKWQALFLLFAMYFLVSLPLVAAIILILR